MDHNADPGEPAAPVAEPAVATIPRRPIDLAVLRALTRSMPPQPKGAGEFVREMRDRDRY